MHYLYNAIKPITWQDNIPIIKKLLLVLSGVFLLASTSQLSIPLNPVPLTFQSTTVILIGMIYGPRHSLYIVSTYLFAGFCGLPIFANFSGGLAKLFSPTVGYLVGFVPAAYISGYLAQKDWTGNIIKSFAAALIGTSIIFLFGIIVLAQYFGWHQAIVFGLVPFIISELVKLVTLAMLIPKFWKKN